MLRLIYDKKTGYSKSYSSAYAKVDYFCMIKPSYYKIFFNLNLCILGMSFQKDVKEQVTHLYVIKDICEAILKINPKIFIIDCIFKSNKYQLLLLNIVGITCLNSPFYVAFGFLFQEQKKDFTKFLTIFRTLYRQLDLKNSKVIITDQDAALMAAIYKVFLHLLCLWHINKYIQAEWKLVFHDTENPKEEWQSFCEK